MVTQNRGELSVCLSAREQPSADIYSEATLRVEPAHAVHHQAPHLLCAAPCSSVLRLKRVDSPSPRSSPPLPSFFFLLHSAPLLHHHGGHRQQRRLPTLTPVVLFTHAGSVRLSHLSLVASSFHSFSPAAVRRVLLRVLAPSISLARFADHPISPVAFQAVGLTCLFCDLLGSPSGCNMWAVSSA